jgi:hypothetical protein
MDELLSSLEVGSKAARRADTVDLVPMLLVNMHGVPVLLISQPPFVSDILILEILVTLVTILYCEVYRPHKWRRKTGASRQVTSAYFLHAVNIFKKRIRHFEMPLHLPKHVPRRLAKRLINPLDIFLVHLREKSGQKVFDERGAGRPRALHLTEKQHRPAHSPGPPSHHRPRGGPSCACSASGIQDATSRGTRQALF